LDILRVFLSPSYDTMDMDKITARQVGQNYNYGYYFAKGNLIEKQCFE